MARWVYSFEKSLFGNDICVPWNRLKIASGQKAKDAGLFDLVKQPDGTLKNCYVYGYVCGVVQDDINIVIPLEVMSFDDKAYSIKINDIEYVLAQEWIDKLMSK